MGVVTFRCPATGRDFSTGSHRRRRLSEADQHALSRSRAPPFLQKHCLCVGTFVDPLGFRQEIRARGEIMEPAQRRGTGFTAAVPSIPRLQVPRAFDVSVQPLLGAKPRRQHTFLARPCNGI